MADSSFMMGDHDKSVAVPFSDDEAANDTKPEELLDDDSPSASPEERITRKQKRQERIKRLLDEGKQNKEEVERLKAESAATRGELERLKGYVAAQPQRQQNDNGKDPYEQRLDQVYEKQSEAYNAAQAEIKAGSFTPERQKYYERVAREIESAKSSIHTERLIEQRTAASRTEQAQQVWVQKYPEVYNNPRAFQYAQASWQRKLALGEQPSNDTVDEIMNETMTTFRLGKKAAPSASERSRMSGIPSAGSGGGGGKGGIVMTDPKLRRMAIAAYSHLPEEEAIKAWVNKTGKRLREKKIL